MYAAIAHIVMSKPAMLIGVSGASPKTKLAAAMVMTSLNMPQTLSVTTLVLCKRANSDAVMRKARTPGNRRMSIPINNPFDSESFSNPATRGPSPSAGKAITSKTRNMIGVRKNKEAKGLDVAGVRRSKI